MGKRSHFEKIPKDKYYTWDKRAGEKFKPYAKTGIKYAEPFAGDGDLIKQLSDIGLECVFECDIESENPIITIRDAFTITKDDLKKANVEEIITNPPWTREILHKVLDHFVPMGYPLWIILDANWLFTKQSVIYRQKWLTDIVPIGRMKWIPNTTMAGKDDVVWLRFSNAKGFGDPANFH